MIHEIKILSRYFEDKITGIKCWKVRENDRNYNPGDMLVEKEWDGKAYTGRSIKELVLKVYMDVPGLKDGYVVMDTMLILSDV